MNHDPGFKAKPAERVGKFRSKSSMEQIESVLPDVVAQLGLERKMREHALMQAWESLLPEAIAKRCRPLFFDYQQNLVIAVSDAAVAQELSLMKAKLLQSLSVTAKALGIEVRALRMDLKQFHKAEEKTVVEEAPRPQPGEHELADIALNNHDMQLIADLSRGLEAESGNHVNEQKVMLLRIFEKQLRLAEWRRRNGFPICQLCQNPVTRLFEHGTHKVCFNCSLSE